MKKDNLDAGLSNRSQKKNDNNRISNYFKNHKLAIVRKIYNNLDLRHGLFFFFTLAYSFGIYIVVDAASIPKITENSIDFDFYFILLILMGPFLFTLLNKLLHHDKNIDNLNKLKLIGFFAVLVLTYLITRNLISANLIDKGYEKYSLTLKTNKGQIIESNDSLLYIGSTKNFYFLRNINSKVNVIYPTAEITEIHIKKLRGGL